MEGSKKFTSAQIAAASGLRIGDRILRADFQDAANRLAQLGPFSNVQFRFSSKAAEVSVEFRLEDAPSVSISFDNFPWFTDEELAQALKDSVKLFDGTAPVQGTILDAMAQSLARLLATRGVHAVVEHALVTRPDNDDKAQQFRVVGAGLNVSEVRFSDKLVANDPRLVERLSDLLGKPYSRSAVELFDLEQIRPIYLEHSYLKVYFGQPQARFAGDPAKPLPETVLVIVPIEPGPAYNWGGATWSGNAAISSTDLTAAIDLRAGVPADGMKIPAAWDRVRAAYGRRGYLDAKVEAQALFDDAAKTASYHVSITEGPQYRMGELVITGLSLDAERRVRATWGIQKGEILDHGYFVEFLEKGVKQALGDLPVHYDEIGRWLRTDPNTATVDVLLDFR